MSFFRIEISLSYFLVTSFWPGEKALANIQNALHNLAFIRNVVKVVQSKVYFVLITLGQKQKFAINISERWNPLFFFIFCEVIHKLWSYEICTHSAAYNI